MAQGLTLTYQVAMLRANNRRGFTLIELILVITLLSFITGMVVVRFAGVGAKAKLQLAAERIAFLDGQTRTLARRQGRGVDVVFYLGTNRVERREASNGDVISGPTQLPGGVRIANVLVGGRHRSTHTLRFGPMGHSPSYSVELSTSGGRLSQTVWVAGLTGQVLLAGGENSVPVEMQW